jgi:hypothetical protein
MDHKPKPGTRVALPEGIRNDQGQPFQHAGQSGIVEDRGREVDEGHVYIKWDNDRLSTHTHFANLLDLTPRTCGACEGRAIPDDYLCESCRSSAITF